MLPDNNSPVALQIAISALLIPRLAFSNGPIPGYVSGVLSILIVNWNTRDLVVKCIQSIFDHPPRREFEVIVVDNASKDGSLDSLRSMPALRGLQVIDAGSNLGFAAGNNLAFRASSGELILTLNPDTEFVDDALERACQILESRPEFPSVAIRQVGVNGETQRSVRGFPTVARLTLEFLGIARLFPATDRYFLRHFDYNLSQPCEQPMATFTLLRKSALGNGELFDENFPIFFNDVDLMKRLAKHGPPCWYFSEAHVVHHGGEGTKQVRKAMIWESHRSLIRYLWKQEGTGLSGLGLFFLTPLVLAAAFLRAKGYDAGFRP
jgi:GT2 family glycosyltransferase